MVLKPCGGSGGLEELISSGGISGLEEKWTKAQSAERAFWEGRVRRMHETSEEVRASRVGAAMKILEGLASLVDAEALERNQILEIGGGPVPLCGFLKPGGVVVDPLADFYRARFRDFVDVDRLKYLVAVGEALPFRDGSFCLVLCDNVLEHVLSPLLLLKEVRRVSRRGTLVYVKVDLYTSRWNLFRDFLTMVGIRYNVHHPHTLGRSQLEAGIRGAGLEIVQAEIIPRLRVGWKWVVDRVLGTVKEAKYLVEVRGCQPQS